MISMIKEEYPGCPHREGGSPAERLPAVAKGEGRFWRDVDERHSPQFTRVHPLACDEADNVCEKRWYHGAVPSFGMGCFLYFTRFARFLSGQLMIVPAGRNSQKGACIMKERLFHPGTLLVVVGAILVYSSGRISALILPGKDRGSDILKGVGCALAVIGALLLFTTT